MSSSERQIPNYAIGLLAVVLVAIGFLLAFSRALPWQSAYEIKAVFKDAQSLRPNSPVRIAGVNIGKVKKVEPVTVNGRGQEASVATMEIEEQGLPIHTDATMRLRPRLFLEGNLFVDVKPGSPFAPEAKDGFTVPPDHTSVSVQFDQVLTALQSDTRRDLQILVAELGDAFQKHGGAEGFREFFRTGGPAFKNTSLVNEALLGTEEGDLGGVVVNAQRTFSALSANEQALGDLITNLRTVTGSLASNDESLRLAIRELPGTLDVGTSALRNLSKSLPALRAFAREALPGVRSSGPALDAANPWVDQLRGLVSKPELRGLSRDLRFAIPDLARLTSSTIPFLEESRALASCFNNVIIPWSESTVPDPFEQATQGPNGDDGQQAPIYKETGYGLVGLGGESRSGDANGQYIRIGGSGGINTVVTPPGIGRPETAGITPFNILGSLPALSASRKTHFVQEDETGDEFICENQEIPDLRSNTGPAPEQTGAANANFQAPGLLGDLLTQRTGIMQDLLQAQFLASQGKKAQSRSLFTGVQRELGGFSRDDGDQLMRLLGSFLGIDQGGELQRWLGLVGGGR